MLILCALTFCFISFPVINGDDLVAVNFDDEFDGVRPEDRGEYSCVAENSLGRTELIFTIVVLGTVIPCRFVPILSMTVPVCLFSQFQIWMVAVQRLSCGSLSQCITAFLFCSPLEMMAETMKTLEAMMEKETLEAMMEKETLEVMVEKETLEVMVEKETLGRVEVVKEEEILGQVKSHQSFYAY